MYKIEWDNSTRGVRLSSLVTSETLGTSPRPVFYEELDLLKMDKDFGWKYPRCQEPLLWCINKSYYYCGEKVFDVHGANLYDSAVVSIVAGCENLEIKPVNVKGMLKACSDEMFLLESEAIEFIRDTYDTYSRASKLTDKYLANQVDFEVLASRTEKKSKQKMAIVKQDCDSFDIMPETEAENQGKKILKTTKIDFFLASFSGGKDSQVVLDLCTRALPPDAFQVIYSDTGYELPSSLKLYEDVQAYYHEKFPTLKFSLAKNHESVLNYWDKIGAPSDKHRWCCAVMKTGPLYRMLKIPETNKQAKVLAFEGVRSEESVMRSGYERIGKGVKHNFVTNARPILKWNTTEIFLYLFRNGLNLNEAYRMGKPRVGCVFCPFSSPWDDMIVNKCYKKELEPFLSRVIELAKYRRIPNLDEYIKERKWKLRASGNMLDHKSSVDFIKSSPNLVAHVNGAKVSIEQWMPAICDFTYKRIEEKVVGEMMYKGKVFEYDIVYKSSANYIFTLHNASDLMLVKAVKRVLYKSTYCISCEVCEVECPTGALSVYPEVKIDNNLCIHCHKCLEFHDHGCIVADSLVTSMDNKTNVGNISKYGTFGIHEEWLEEFSLNPEVDFWLPNNNSLGNKMVPSFKSWLRDAEIIDNKNVLTDFGRFCVDNLTNDSELIWSLIWINLSYNSELVKWFVNNIHKGQIFDTSHLIELGYDHFAYGFSRNTIEYAYSALMQLFKYSPIGEGLNQGELYEKKSYVRNEYLGLSEIALAYSLYKYANVHQTRSLRVKDFYEEDAVCGIVKEFCISKERFEKLLRTLNSGRNRILTAELNMGLNHITLQEGIEPFDVLCQLF